jgi:hypothetical protein
MQRATRKIVVGSWHHVRMVKYMIEEGIPLLNASVSSNNICGTNHVKPLIYELLIVYIFTIVLLPQVAIRPEQVNCKFPPPALRQLIYQEGHDRKGCNIQLDILKQYQI